jgi:hypothetical protein
MSQNQGIALFRFLLRLDRDGDHQAPSLCL